MDKLLKWVITHKIKAILFLLAIIILLPIGILILYTIGSSKPNTPFSADDLLLYWGSVLTFLGTSFLGFWSLSQNQKFKIENDNSQNRLNNAVEKLEEANKKQAEISSMLLRVQRDNDMPILYFEHGNISYYHSSVEDSITISLKVKVEHGKSIYTEYENLRFYHNINDYATKENVIQYIAINLFESEIAKTTHVVSANDVFELKFDYHNVSVEKIEKYIEVVIYTTDIYGVNRTNIFGLKIDKLDINLLKYAIETKEEDTEDA